MKDILDVHTHTLASGHAYNTIREMAEAARKKGLALLGITEHAPNMPGSCHDFYFSNLKVIERHDNYGLELLFGVELNIMDRQGTVDLSQERIAGLDLTIASLHPPCIPFGSMEENTEAVINALKNPLINIAGHLDDGRYPLDYRAVAQAAAEYHKLVEVNNSSLAPGSYRAGAGENYKLLLKYCMDYRVPVVVNSDAHIDTAVGEHGLAMAILEETGFPEELVVNTDVEKLRPYLLKYRQ